MEGAETRDDYKEMSGLWYQQYRERTYVGYVIRDRGT